MLWGFAIPITQALAGICSAGYARPPLGVPYSVAPDMSYPPLGVPADMLSAVKK